MKNHQQRLLAALESNLESNEPSLELSWDQTVASNVGYVGSVWPGEVTAHKRMHVNFQADYATFKPMVDGHMRDKGSVYVNIGHPSAEEQFKRVLEFLCTR